MTSDGQPRDERGRFLAEIIFGEEGQGQGQQQERPEIMTLLEQAYQAQTEQEEARFDAWLQDQVSDAN